MATDENADTADAAPGAAYKNADAATAAPYTAAEATVVAPDAADESADAATAARTRRCCGDNYRCTQRC
eukprot:243871-Pleurochrysis_carterae.AAC.1